MMKPRSAPVTSIAESSTSASTSSSTRPDPSARSPSSSAAICRSSIAADAALFSADGASSPIGEDDLHVGGLAEADAIAASVRASIFSSLTKVPKVDCRSCSTHASPSRTISACSREMSAPGRRRSVSLRRPIENTALSIGTMRRPSASVTIRRGWSVPAIGGRGYEAKSAAIVV